MSPQPGSTPDRTISRPLEELLRVILQTQADLERNRIELEAALRQAALEVERMRTYNAQSR